MKKCNTLAFIAFMFLILIGKSGLASAQDLISITIICDMRDTTDLQSYDPSVMYLTGHWTPPTEPGKGDWTFFTMDSIAPNIFRYTFEYELGFFAGNEADDPDLLADCPGWYFAPTDDWSTAENVPAPCNVAWDIQRIFVINPDDPDTIVAFKYGVCEPEPLNDLGLPEYSGIDEVQNQNLLIYPNPSNGMLYVDCSFFQSKTQIELMDISGRVVKKIENAAGTVAIDITGMPSSIYLVRVSDGSSSVLRKIVLR
ncbi:MAG: hypothetical protein H6Q21_1335 [Bacteroidetes bacterium]|jgi:hypothetical protein|nr:hypothetical protein [Bacteroidota bacterium]